MKLSELQIIPRQFFTIGVISFLIIGLMNLINFFVFWPVNNIWAKIGGGFGIIFNLALVLFFNYLRNMEPEFSEEYASDDITKVIKDITKGGKKK